MYEWWLGLLVYVRGAVGVDGACMIGDWVCRFTVCMSGDWGCGDIYVCMHVRGMCKCARGR